MKTSLLRTFHIGGYWRGPNDMVRQMMLGLRAAQAEVYEYNTDEHPEALDCEGRVYDRGTFGPVWLRFDVLQLLLDQFRPDLIVCNAGGLSFRPNVSKSLRRSATLLGIALSDPDVFAVATSRIAPNFDLFLTNAPSCIPAYQSIGVNVGVLPLATNEAFFYPVDGRPELECEVLVIGRAHADRIDPVRRLCECFNTHLYGEGWEPYSLPSRGTLYEEELLSALNSARVSIIFSRTPAGHSIGKVAVFDFLAAGALVATEHIPELESYLNYGQEIIGFTSADELMAKIRYYLEHPEQAHKVREAGRARVLADHTWRKAWCGIVPQLPRIGVAAC